MQLGGKLGFKQGLADCGIKTHRIYETAAKGKARPFHAFSTLAVESV